MTDRTYSYVVVYRRATTQTEVDRSKRYRYKSRAEQLAAEYNRTNQDQTWNHITADVIRVRRKVEK